MPVILSILTILVILFYLGKTYYLNRFNREVRLLFRNSGHYEGKKYNSDMLDGLPEPVKKYFTGILKDGQEYVSYVRLKHSGRFKTGLDKEWTDITGEQYYTSLVPGFAWRGKTRLFSAVDSYYKSSGGLQVQLLGAIPIVNASGGNYNQAELLRWLGESVWFPTNILPRGGLRWKPVDERTSRLELEYEGISVYYIVTFNENFEIYELETERYMDKHRMEKWRGRVGKYIEVNGIKIPSEITAMWVIEGKEKPYAEFRVTEIDYDIPAKF